MKIWVIIRNSDNRVMASFPDNIDANMANPQGGKALAELWLDNADPKRNEYRVELR